MKLREPGPRSQKLCRRDEELLAPGVQQIARFAGIALERGSGARVWDVDGNEYIDLVAGVCVNNIGHAHPRFTSELGKQLEKITVGSFVSTVRVELLELLSGMLPAGLERVQLYSSGAEAVESAIRLAKSVTGHYEVVSFWSGFHGKTAGVLGLLGSDFKHGLGPFVPGAHLSPYPDPYRPPPVAADKGVVQACLEFLNRKLEMETDGRIAAIIVEPAQGTAGNVFPEPGFLPGLRQIADKWGALLILDEMITGFGRTGRLFGLERDPVTADVLTIGKGFGGGFPITGVVTRREHAEAKPWSNPSHSSSSHGGNPLACAAALASLRIVQDENLVENSRRMGQRLLDGLRPFVDRYSFVGMVGGEGLMLRLELVRDKTTKAPLEKTICREIFQESLRRGLLTMAYTSAVRINPPLVIDEELVDRSLQVLREVCDQIEDKHFS